MKSFINLGHKVYVKIQQIDSPQIWGVYQAISSTYSAGSPDWWSITLTNISGSGRITNACAIGYIVNGLNGTQGVQGSGSGEVS